MTILTTQHAPSHTLSVQPAIATLSFAEPSVLAGASAVEDLLTQHRRRIQVWKEWGDLPANIGDYPDPIEWTEESAAGTIDEVPPRRLFRALTGHNIRR